MMSASHGAAQEMYKQDPFGSCAADGDWESTMAMVAGVEWVLSERTKAALAAAEARGVKLGGQIENLKNSELGARDVGSPRTNRARSR